MLISFPQLFILENSEPIVLPLWRSLHSLNLMLPKEDRKAMLLRLYNDDSPLMDHSKDRFAADNNPPSPPHQTTAEAAHGDHPVGAAVVVTRDPPEDATTSDLRKDDGVRIEEDVDDDDDDDNDDDDDEEDGGVALGLGSGEGIMGIGGAD